MTALNDAEAFSPAARTLVQAEHRAWVRRPTPVWPFVWRGLAPLLAFLLLAVYACWPFAQREIEAVVLAQTRAALAAHQATWAQVKVSGQEVVLSGTPPSTEAGEAARQRALAVTCPTAFGLLACVDSVRTDFSAAPAAATPNVTLPTELRAAQICASGLTDILARSSIHFAVGSADIPADDAIVLDTVAKTLLDCPGVLKVDGYTDLQGDPEMNLRLSQDRAASVRQALIARGVPAARLQSEGFGAAHPLADNGTPEGRARNRRIEVSVVTTPNPAGDTK